MANILFITQSLNKGGSEKQLASIAEKIRSRGHDSTVLALSEGGWWCQYLQNNNVPVTVLKFPQVKKTSSFAREFMRLISAIKHHKPDIIVSFLYEPSILASIAAYVAGVPLYLSSRRDCGFQRARSSFPRFIEKLSYRVTAKFVVNSMAVKQCLCDQEGIPEKKVDIIYNGIDVPRLNKEESFSIRSRWNIPHDSIVVGMMANFWRHKNQLMLVRAAQMVIEKRADVYFILIGRSSPYKSDVKQEVDRLHLHKHIVLLEATDLAADILAAIDIGVLCSVSEGFSNTILEYMASEKPVIATRVGGNSELVIDGVTGYLVTLNDDLAMAQFIIELAGNGNKRTKMGLEGRKCIERGYTWSAIMDKWNTTFLDLLSQRT